MAISGTNFGISNPNDWSLWYLADAKLNYNEKDFHIPALVRLQRKKE